MLSNSNKIRALPKDAALRERARRVIPGGMWGHMDAKRVAQGFPQFFAEAKGTRLRDVDGNEYLDFIGGHGALILGHADELVVAAVAKGISKGSGFGVPSDLPVRLAELIVSRLDAVDMVRFVDTPTDAIQGAVSLARVHTGRDRIVWVARDACQRPGTAQEHFADPDSVDLVFGYEGADAVEALFSEHGPTIAAVFVDPLGAVRGLDPPPVELLRALRDCCDSNGALLIFDERISAFRVAGQAAATIHEVSPDLTILGSIIGGGLPLAAFAGRTETMRRLEVDAAGCTRHAPRRRWPPPSGNLPAMGAGIATLQAIGEPGFYENLNANAMRLDEGLRAASTAAGIRMSHARVGSIVSACPDGATMSTDASEAQDVHTWFARYYEAMLDRGILLPPTPLSCIFVSAAHSQRDIDRMVDAAGEALGVAGRR